ncbi:MAG: 2-isopropylmalate synthase [Gammaproteobacteria bacterium]|nr:2-isopropylmalate synthase [Gammaproteobacteria bacterium]
MSMHESQLSGSKSGVMPYGKYRAFSPIELPDRSWPHKQLNEAPMWCSVDLRDGNQALIDPMTVEEKTRMFELLVGIGFIEIEVGFPAASQPDFDFIRKLIDQDLVPDNVTLQVLCQAREELITRTIEALDGAKKAIFHLYNSTSTLQRRVVFDMDQSEIVDLAVSGTELVRKMCSGLTSTDIRFEYSPESFTGTELDFAIEVSEAVAKTWGATPDHKIIINLPSTVELATPNIYADQIEYFCRNYKYRDSSVISLHTHNDRGTGVAATELALMAGAERVEGTLFGNGERTGNCDLVTVAMNLFSQGVDPQLDLRDMTGIRETVIGINKLPVHPRHPYAGDLVFTAFSGSHQDAIRKGMAQVDRERWEVPYLPIDPADIGASYRESVRVNSQSGKGGVGFILEEYFDIHLPRDMLVEFARDVQSLTETKQREVSPDEILEQLFLEYCVESGPYRLLSWELAGAEPDFSVNASIALSDSFLELKGNGATPIDGFVNSLVETINEPLELEAYQLYGTSNFDGVFQKVPQFGIATVSFEGQTYFGISRDRDVIKRSFLAVLSALNRQWRENSGQTN